MRKMLLFRVGTEQYAIDLACVKSIQRVKHIIEERQESSNLPNLEIDDEQTLRFDLISIFDKEETGGRDFENEKLIMLEVRRQSMGIIVSRVDNVVSLDPDRIKPLSPIFKGFAMSCFPKVLQHEDAIILILAPEGLIDVLQAGHKPPAGEEEIVDIFPETIETADIDDKSHNKQDSFPANLEQFGRDASS